MDVPIVENLNLVRFAVTAVKSKCYREHKQEFYVYAKPNVCDPKTVIKYIGRYLGRPVIATSRSVPLLNNLLFDDEVGVEGFYILLFHSSKKVPRETSPGTIIIIYCAFAVL